MNSPPVSRRERRLHQLLSDARNGDRDALRLFADDTGTGLWRVAALLTDEHDASELVAATMQIVLEPRTALPPVGEMRIHLLRTLYHLAASWRGTGSGVLSMLPLPHRAFHALTQLGGLSHLEVAAVCHVDVTTVRAGCAAARSILANRPLPPSHVHAEPPDDVSTRLRRSSADS